MLNLNDLRKLIDGMCMQDKFYLVVLAREENIALHLSEIKRLGYFAMVRQTSFGIEIVITDKEPHDNN